MLEWEKQTKKAGFTIVELLIVVVVIAILAAITIVSYNGISNRAKDTAVQTLARDFGVAVERYSALNGGYPSMQNADLDVLDFKINKSAIQGTHNRQNDPNGYNFGYCVNDARDRFILNVISPSGKTYQYRSGAGLQEVAWVTGGYPICAAVGVSTTNPNWAYTGGPGGDSWKIWVE